MENSLNPANKSDYSKYGFVNPFHIGIQASRAQRQTATAAIQYQDAHTLDRLVGTTKGILRESHFDLDLPPLEKSLSLDLGEYKIVLTKAGIHLAQAARTFQDYGHGKHVNMSAADIRASASLCAFSTTNYTLETAVGLINSKQLVIQSAYSHQISDLHQQITQQTFLRSNLSFIQSKKLAVHAESYTVGAKETTVQIGKGSIYYDKLTLNVGTGNYAQENGNLNVKAANLILDTEQLTLKSSQYNQTSEQYSLYGTNLNISGTSANISGATLNLGGNTVRIGGGIVFIGGAVPRASRPIEQLVEELDVGTFESIPTYKTESLIRSQEASGVELGGVKVISPPQGTAGAEVKRSSQNQNTDLSTYSKPELQSSNVVSRPQL